MTTAEMLASVEAQIRKDIPRLMELREGCVIEYFRGSRAYNCKVVETFPSYFNAYFDGEIESIDFELSENTFQIIGHDIMLNDVLEWFIFNDISIVPQCNKSESIMMLFYIEYDEWGNFYHYNVPWNLSSPYLNEDQSEELIKFLYNLKNGK